VSDPIIVVEGLWKSYPGAERLGIKEFLLKRRPRGDGRYTRQWALQDITFSVGRGESFGIVGHNGTGKSTLLGLLLGTMTPDKGTVSISGPVASLLELGAGFHPELTGRENLFLHGSILGMTLNETRRAFDSIVAFSELGGAIDRPIRTYSAGMVARLGFSIVIHASAEVLLIDEVLDVGDMSFQEKCKTYLRDFVRRGGTLVIVSHDMDTVASMCGRGMCLNLGGIQYQGPIDGVIAQYRALMIPAGHPAAALQ
jgi:ABC-type polysaccharide/polyol phosphate transport system ATPase subunit